MEKPVDYNLSNSLPYKEWKQEWKDYKNWQRRIRMNPKTANMTQEEYKQYRSKVLADTRKKWHDKWNNMSDEEKSIINAKKGNFWNNASDKDKEKMRNRLTGISQSFWDSMSDEERKEFGQYRWNLKSDKEKDEIITRFNQAGVERMKNLSKEEIDAQIKMMNEARAKKFENDKEFRETQIELLKKHCKEYWDNISDDEREKIKNKMKERYENLSDEEKQKISETTSKRNKKWWNSRTPEQLKEISERVSKMNEDITPEKRREMIISAMGNNNFHKKFESYFNSSYLSNEYFLVPETVIENSISHSWDYGIYSKDTNELVMVVDLDGSYFHADSCDYDGLHSKEEMDTRRLYAIPNNVKYEIIPQDSLSKSFDKLIKSLMIDYDSFIQNEFNYARSMPFPYPHYTDNELIKSWIQLKNMKCDDKYHQNISLNNREGDRIINNFHESIYQAHRKGNISPYDAWYDDKLLMKVIKNRLIYINNLNPNKILQGFNISKVAQKVSVFSAGRAKMLIYKYLNDCNEIFDPFSGFSGRMLGAVSLGKRYIGQDISAIHVRESNEIIKFLHKYCIGIDAIITQQDILQSNGEYECLFTCSPYQDIEQWQDVPVSKRTCDDWIDECLSRFKCRKYLFVVDYTDKYKNYIVDEIKNKSHFGSNSEYVILIQK